MGRTADRGAGASRELESRRGGRAGAFSREGRSGRSFARTKALDDLGGGRAAVVVAAVLAWPAGRVLAQQFWQFLYGSTEGGRGFREKCLAGGCPFAAGETDGNADPADPGARPGRSAVARPLRSTLAAAGSSHFRSAPFDYVSAIGRHDGEGGRIWNSRCARRGSRTSACRRNGTAHNWRSTPARS